MKIIKGARGTGKTKELIQLAHESASSVIVCKNVDAILEKIHRYGFSNISVISYDEYIHGTKDDSVYYIDEMNEFIQYLSDNVGKIEGYTLVE